MSFSPRQQSTDLERGETEQVSHKQQSPESRPSQKLLIIAFAILLMASVIFMVVGVVLARDHVRKTIVLTTGTGVVSGVMTMGMVAAKRSVMEILTMGCLLWTILPEKAEGLIS